MKQLQDFRSQLAALVNIDSNSADREGVGKIGKYLSRKYLEMGLLVEAFDDDTRIQAKSHDEEDFDLLFVGHMDTVFQKGTAQQLPYKENDGFAYGPGVADMKAGLVLILHLVQALRRERPDLRICIANNGDEEIGSICSGGRYDNLAEYYTNKQLPGVGISIGLTRLFYVLQEQKMLNEEAGTAPADVLLLPMTEELGPAIELGTRLRGEGIRVQLYTEPKKFKAKMNYADKLGVPFVVFLGEDEIQEEVVSCKDMVSGEQTKLDFSSTVTRVKERLAANRRQRVIR